MEASMVQAAKLAIVAATGLSKDTLHVCVGLSVFLLFAFVRRDSPRFVEGWFAVLIVALGGEALDMGDELAHLGYWRWWTSLHDVANTLLWPTVFITLWSLVRLVNQKNHPGPGRTGGV